MKSDVPDSSQSYWVADTMDLVLSPSVTMRRMLECAVQVNLPQAAQMATSVWLVVEMSMKVEWRCVMARGGEPSVMITGGARMLWWFAISWDTLVGCYVGHHGP